MKTFIAIPLFGIVAALFGAFGGIGADTGPYCSMSNASIYHYPRLDMENCFDRFFEAISCPNISEPVLNVLCIICAGLQYGNFNSSSCVYPNNTDCISNLQSCPGANLTTFDNITSYKDGLVDCAASYVYKIFVNENNASYDQTQ